MINNAFHVSKQFIMITGFVFVMMLVIEYVKVNWQFPV